MNSFPNMISPTGGMKTRSRHYISSKSSEPEMMITSATAMKAVKSIKPKSLKPKSLPVMIAYTDGSYDKKTKCCGYGVHFSTPMYGVCDISEPLRDPKKTSQRAELYAIIACLEMIIRTDAISKISKVVIYSDSSYSINSVTKWMAGWKKRGWTKADGNPIMNRDLIERLDELVSEFDDYRASLDFTHIRSHTGNDDEHSIGNDIADRLAKEGARKEVGDRIPGSRQSAARDHSATSGQNTTSRQSTVQNERSDRDTSERDTSERDDSKDNSTSSHGYRDSISAISAIEKGIFTRSGHNVANIISEKSGVKTRKTAKTNKIRDIIETIEKSSVSSQKFSKLDLIEAILRMNPQ